MKKLSRGRNRSLIKDFTSGPSLIKDSGRLDTRKPEMIDQKNGGRVEITVLVYTGFF